MEVKMCDCQVTFDPDIATITFDGCLRVPIEDDYDPLIKLLDYVREESYEAVTLDLRKLEYLNDDGISVLSKFVIAVRKNNTMSLLVQGSKEFAWQGQFLKNLQRFMPNLNLEMF